MKLIIILLLTLGCNQQNYYYFFEKAPVYNFPAEHYLENNGTSIVEKGLPTHSELPFSFNFIEMPFDLVVGIESPNYSMLEIINLIHENENLWFTLESLNNGQQIIGLPANKKKQDIIKKFARIMSTPTYQANLAVNQKKEQISISFIQNDYISFV